MHDADALIRSSGQSCNSEPVGELRIETWDGEEWVPIRMLAITERQAQAYLEFVADMGRLPEWTRA